ncbi:hypothetical protein VPH35_047918 [Triticum aestivum]
MNAAGEGDGDGNGMCFPYDVLLDILRRLPGRDIAASQCVCRLWRAIIDNHGLSLERYFPRRAFAGIFVNKTGCRSNLSFFAPPTTEGKPGFLRPAYPHEATIRQSCNGLLLVREWGDYYVLNPATAWSAHLPCPSTCRADVLSLAFDPAVSLHYRVFLLQKDELLLPRHRSRTGKVLPLEEVQEERIKEPKEKLVPMLVYSSFTCQWEDQEFTPGRCAPGHLYDVVARSPDSYMAMFRSTDYWHGSIYIHCHNNVLMILRPSKGTYDMVELPGEHCSPKSLSGLPKSSVLASYERGIQYVAINVLQLRVWMLTEAMNGQLGIGWTLAHDVNLNPDSRMIHPLIIQSKVTWRAVGSSGEPPSSTEDDNEDEEEDEEEGVAREDGSEHSWNPDEDNFIDVLGEVAHHGVPAWGFNCKIVGFHPHKDALILMDQWTVVVYHLDTLKMQYLGERKELTKDDEQQANRVDDSFTYRPCYRDVLPCGKFSVPS